MKYRSAFARRYYAEGLAAGLAERVAVELAAGIIRVLTLRGLTVPEEMSERLLTCGDIPALSTWLQRAATATTLDGLLD